MAITHIVRDWGVGPAIVRITSTDDYATISASGYITSQAANIQLANNGAFEWLLSDVALVWYQNDFGVGAWAFFSISSDFTSLSALSPSAASIITLSAAQVLAAYAIPQLLVAAPGAGQTILVNNAKVITEVSTQFGGGGVGIVQYGNTVHGAGTDALSATIPSAEITASASQIYTMTGYVATTVSTGITNKGLYFSNQTGAFTGGAGSTLSFALQYIVVPALV